MSGSERSPTWSFARTSMRTLGDSRLCSTTSRCQILISGFLAARLLGARLFGLCFLGAGFNSYLRVVGQAVIARSYDAISGLQSFRNLSLIALANADFNGLLVGTIIGTNEHHRRAAIRGCEQRRCGYHQSVGKSLRQH